jgi:hypothetical protein
MIVEIDEAGTYDEAFAIDRLSSSAYFDICPNGDDGSITNGHISVKRLAARAIDNRATLQQKVDVRRFLGGKTIDAKCNTPQPKQ